MLNFFNHRGLFKKNAEYRRSEKKYFCKLRIKTRAGEGGKVFCYNPKSMETTRTSNLP